MLRVVAKCALVMCTIVLVCTLAGMCDTCSNRNQFGTDKRVACGNKMVKLRETGDDKQVRTVEKYVPVYYCPPVHLPVSRACTTCFTCVQSSTKTQCCNQPTAEPCCREPSMFELDDM